MQLIDVKSWPLPKTFQVEPQKLKRYNLMDEASQGFIGGASVHKRLVLQKAVKFLQTSFVVLFCNKKV